MKKVFSAIIMVVALVALTGCNGEAEEVAEITTGVLSCEMTASEEGYETILSIELDFEDKIVEKLTLSNSIKASDEEGIASLATSKISIDDFYSDMNDKDGVTITSKVVDDTISVDIEVDYTVVSEDDDLVMPIIPAIITTADTVVTEIKSGLETSGYTCTIKEQ